MKALNLKYQILQTEKKIKNNLTIGEAHNIMMENQIVIMQALVDLIEEMEKPEYGPC
jgi:hypothetical protein